MKEFIQAFKNTSYYQSLFNSYEILGIYLLGSQSVGITDEGSDYDIAILTLNGEDTDVSKEKYLMYKDKKVHWYYCAIENLFNVTYNTLKILCPIQLRNICDDLIIYENPKYNDILYNLHETKYYISTLGIYRLFELKKYYINEIINEGQILEKHHTKYLYHLCLASYYLTGEELEKDFLRSLKRIRWQPVPEEYKQLAIERLKVYKHYIEQNPIDVGDTMKSLYSQLEIEKYGRKRKENIYVY